MEVVVAPLAAALQEDLALLQAVRIHLRAALEVEVAPWGCRTIGRAAAAVCVDPPPSPRPAARPRVSSVPGWAPRAARGVEGLSAVQPPLCRRAHSPGEGRTPARPW
eukprot:15485776-Alexandrium_andersonii.AAC.1